jgi:hypothetical protein
MSNKKTRSLLDAAFEEFERAEASDSLETTTADDGLDGLDLEGEGEFSLDDGEGAGEGEGESEGEGEGSGFEGSDDSDLGTSDEGGEGEFSLEDNDGEGEGEDAEGEDDLGGEFSADDSEDSEDAEDAEGAYASVEEIEAEFEAIAKEQGLDRLPEGVTAAAAIDFLLDNGAIWELRPIEASESYARRRAVAAFDEDVEGGEEGEEGVESPVLDDDEEMSAQLSPVTNEGAMGADEDDGIDLGDEPTDLGDIDEGAEGAESCEATASVSTETNYHPVADTELIATAAVQDVQMVLTNGEDPRWNFIIAGVPAAFISLSNIENGEAVRNGFVSQQYCDSIVSAMSKLGVAAVLEQNGAQFYANEVMASDLATSIRASVADELSGEFTSRVVALREDFLDRANLVAAGVSKGYFTSLPNALFTKAREVLANYGVRDADAAAMAIAAAAPEFFSVIAEKAASLMDKSPETLADLRENIEDSAPRTPVTASAPAASMSLASRLADQTLTNPAPTPVQASTTAPVGTVDLSRLVGRLGQRSGTGRR